MTEIVKSGFLYKQSRHLKHWRNRWCVITQDNLLTFKNKNLFSHPTQKIPLNNILSITEDRDSTSVIIIETVDGTKFLFDAICFNDKNDWLATLKRAVQNWFDRNCGDGWKRLQRIEVEQICY